MILNMDCPVCTWLEKSRRQRMEEFRHRGHVLGHLECVGDKRGICAVSVTCSQKTHCRSLSDEHAITRSILAQVDVHVCPFCKRRKYTYRVSCADTMPSKSDPSVLSYLDLTTLTKMNKNRTKTQNTNIKPIEFELPAHFTQTKRFCC